MSRRTLALGASLLALVVAGAAVWAITTGRMEQRPANGAIQLEPGAPADDGSVEPDAGTDTTRTPGSDVEALPDEQVPDEAAYEIVDALSDAGVPPVMGSELTVEYLGRLDRVRVTGTFTDTGEKTMVLVYRSGSWQLEE
jgi:hypothetical protein